MSLCSAFTLGPAEDPKGGYDANSIPWGDVPSWEDRTEITCMTLGNSLVNVGSCQMLVPSIKCPEEEQEKGTETSTEVSGEKVGEKEDFWGQQVQHHTANKHFLGTQHN